MIRFLLILAALVVAVPAAADPTRSFRAPWLVLDADCTDLYDTPAPPSGAVDLTTLTNWDTKSEAVSLQDNFNAPAQTSGDPDGFCDADVATIKGSLTTAADSMLWIGPILWPSAGGLLISDYDAIATDHQVYFMVELPWDTANGTTFAGTTSANTSLARQLWTFGPFIASSTNLETSDEVPFPTGRVFMVLNWDGAGSWTVNMSLVPFRAELYGRD